MGGYGSTPLITRRSAEPPLQSRYRIIPSRNYSNCFITYPFKATPPRPLLFPNPCQPPSFSPSLWFCHLENVVSTESHSIWSFWLCFFTQHNAVEIEALCFWRTWHCVARAFELDSVSLTFPFQIFRRIRFMLTVIWRSTDEFPHTVIVSLLTAAREFSGFPSKWLLAGRDLSSAPSHRGPSAASCAQPLPGKEEEGCQGEGAPQTLWRSLLAVRKFSWFSSLSCFNLLLGGAFLFLASRNVNEPEEEEKNGWVSFQLLTLVGG